MKISLLILIWQITLITVWSNKICPYCQYENNSDTREYCLRCAALLLKKTLMCTYCQSENQIGSEYCINCEKKIKNIKIKRLDKITKKDSSIKVTDKKINQNSLLLEKFQKDFRENKISKYSINHLLKLKSMNSTVDVFVKKGTKTTVSIPNGPTIISIATVNHYKPVKIKDAISNILKKKVKNNPAIKHKIFAALSNSDPLIKASAASSCCDIDFLRDHPALDSKLIYLLKDQNSFVKETALSLILRPQSKAIDNPYLFEIVIKISKNKQLDTKLRESAIFSLYYILNHYKDCIKQYKSNTKTIQSIKNRISDLQNKITLSEKNRKQTDYYNNKAKDHLEKQTIRNTKMLKEEQNRLKIISQKTENNERITNNYLSYFNRTKQIYKHIIKNCAIEELKNAAANALKDIEKLKTY